MYMYIYIYNIYIYLHYCRQHELRPKTHGFYTACSCSPENGKSPVTVSQVLSSP